MDQSERKNKRWERNCNWQMWENSHSSRQSTIEIRLKHEHQKWTLYPDCSDVLSDLIFSPPSSHLVRVPDVNTLNDPESSEVLFLSTLLNIDGLIPEEKYRVAAEAAEFSVQCVKNKRRSRSRYLGVSIVVEIEVVEVSCGMDGGWKEVSRVINEEESTCAVCLEDMNAAAAAPVIKMLPCRHVFHFSFIRTWCLNHDSCPVPFPRGGSCFS